MNSIERRTLNQLRLIRTGRVSWEARSSFRIVYKFGTVTDPDRIWFPTEEWAKLADDLFVRHGAAHAQTGKVSLSAKGEALLMELEDEDTEECIHGLGPKTACTICNGKAGIAADDPWRTFPAKYAAQCNACNLPIEVGQIIAWREGDRAIHEGCRP